MPFHITAGTGTPVLALRELHRILRSGLGQLDFDIAFWRVLDVP